MRNTWWQSYCWCLRDYGCFNNSLGNVEISVRERPLNLKGGGGGGVMVFFQKNILIPNAAEKNILILVEEKKNNLIQSFCHIT